MANALRGEASLMIEGRERVLCLTLGALAEIETGLGCQSLSELSRRLSDLSPTDMLTVLRALVRGGGDSDLAERLETVPVSPGEAARAIADAFRLAFED